MIFSLLYIIRQLFIQIMCKNHLIQVNCLQEIMNNVDLPLVSSPEPKAQGELIVYQSSRRLSVCLSVCLWTFSNLNISATSGPIVAKF